MKIISFKDLLVWKLANELSGEIYELVKTFPKEEKYDLIGQLKRSSRSVPANISEGWGRFHFNDKLSYYDRSLGSLEETENHLIEARKNNYIDEEKKQCFDNKILKIMILLKRMIKNIIKKRDEYIGTKKFRREATVSARKRSFRPAKRDCFRPKDSSPSLCAPFQAAGNPYD